MMIFRQDFCGHYEKQDLQYLVDFSDDDHGAVGEMYIVGEKRRGLGEWGCEEGMGVVQSV